MSEVITVEAWEALRKSLPDGFRIKIGASGDGKQFVVDHIREGDDKDTLAGAFNTVAEVEAFFEGVRFGGVV